MSKLNKKIKKLVKELVAQKLAEYEKRTMVQNPDVDMATGEVTQSTGSVETNIVPRRTEPTGVKSVVGYFAKYKGLYRRFDKTYTSDKTDPSIKLYQGQPDRLMRKLAKEEGILHEDFSYELANG